MPFGRWGRKPPEDAGSPDRAARQADSLRALAAGGLPREATDRLTRQEGGGLPWTSTLTVPDFLTCRILRLVPVGQVMGSSVMHIGFNPQWLYGAWQNGDVAPVSRAMEDARRLALDRLRQEAELLGAHGVVNVTLTATRPAWGTALVEFQAIGTAVKLSAASPPDQLFLGTLSAQDTEKLLAAGYLPMNLVYATTAYYVMTDWTSQAQEMSWTNQEVSGFSRAVYEARAYVVSRMRAAARDVGADGVLGATWTFEVEEFEVERPLMGSGFVGGFGGGAQSVTDHMLYITVTGTAVGALRATWPAGAVRPVVPLTDRPGAGAIGLSPATDQTNKTGGFA